MPTAVVHGTVDHLRQIIEHLQADLERSTNETGGSFFFNRNMIEEAQAAGRLRVLFNEDRMVGFLTGDAGAGDIDLLEVWHSLRGCGYGRKLVESFIAEAMTKNTVGIKVLCIPQSSIAFWEGMGFRASLGGSWKPDSERPERYLVFPEPEEAAANAPRSRIKIELMQDDTNRSDLPAFETDAAFSDEMYILAKPFTIAHGPRITVMRISIDGRVVYDDYIADAEWHGVEHNGCMVRVRHLFSDTLSSA